MTLSSQLPRSSSAAGNASWKRRALPVALGLIGAVGFGTATYFFSQGKDTTPTAELIATNTVPALTGVPVPAPPPVVEMPAITPHSVAKPVAIVTNPIAPPTQPPNVAPAIVALSERASPAPTQLNRPQSSMNFATALAMKQGDPVSARLALTQLLDQRALAAADLTLTIAALREINAQLFFSPNPVVGDPTIRMYTVVAGDTLAKIAKRNDVQTDWRMIQRMNGMTSEKSLRVGQKLKLPVGAFHAEVSKSTFEMKLYCGEGASRVLIAAFPVGLGEVNSTPTGAFMVRPKSKLINPQWTNPRTGEKFAADDPKNPIGERWIGLVGVEAHNQGFKGYGIHGTIDAASIGKQASMGCVRMTDSNVELAYELLTEPNSTIVIVP
ncbi:MAG: LysM peptidoglycan-binding domain-containing protein [Phycisphaerales bacterium]|nr:LysM peptidoglycan-binding domain-containing protein [Phycisphaerales bacterium]